MRAKGFRTMRSSGNSASDGHQVVPQAIRDVESIRDYIAQDSPRYAELTVGRILASVERLHAFPQSGRVVPERGNPEIRELLWAPSESFIAAALASLRLPQSSGRPGCSRPSNSRRPNNRMNLTRVLPSIW